MPLKLVSKISLEFSGKPKSIINFNCAQLRTNRTQIILINKVSNYFRHQKLKIIEIKSSAKLFELITLQFSYPKIFYRLSSGSV
jgi:hypothetical protein